MVELCSLTMDANGGREYSSCAGGNPNSGYVGQFWETSFTHSMASNGQYKPHDFEVICRQIFEEDYQYACYSSKAFESVHAELVNSVEQGNITLHRGRESTWRNYVHISSDVEDIEHIQLKFTYEHTVDDDTYTHHLVRRLKAEKPPNMEDQYKPRMAYGQTAEVKSKDGNHSVVAKANYFSTDLEYIYTLPYDKIDEYFPGFTL